MYKLTKIAGAVLGVVATMGVAGVANAIPVLQIVGSGGGAPVVTNQEAIGDPGGSVYPSAPGVPPGSGLPTALGGWPVPTSFDNDTTFGDNLGISGYDGSYLLLSEAANVTFQYMGHGNSTNTDLFQTSSDGGATWVTKFINQTSPNCGASGGSPLINCSNPGSSFSQAFNAGLIAFRFVNTTTPGTATNDGSGNLKDGPPGYFLGMDPYLTGTQYDTTGSAAYAGFSDLPQPGDHDYQDLVVRVSVPEPGTTLLLAAGLMGLAFGRRRQS